MTQATHTPGPWENTFPSNGQHRVIAGQFCERAILPRQGNDQYIIAEFFGPDAIANAILTKAAPDMLAALERLAARVVETAAYDEAKRGHDPELLLIVQESRAAIAKATP